MRLYEKETTACVRLFPVHTEDGEGGTLVSYREGDAFRAHFTMLTGTEQEIAGQRRSRSRFTVTVPAEMHHFFPGDVFRNAEGRLFTVTGEAECTPSSASFSFVRFPAESWEDAAGFVTVQSETDEKEGVV
ncbi:MAG: head-tail adaptor protein [Clostridia bacterium]|nr:head-tail adaptor protein [Clostridia bacterium]